ncbi:MAG: PaaI family thioesterase [Candidatus Latescibacterota bacterium]|jgi:acyl-coenzyme A thioesterase PaaI-like protein
MTTKKSFQDYYPDDVAHCYGCGTLNEHGHHIKSYWDGEETVCVFEPQPYHTAVPGYVYGGLIASLIDCHGTGSAAAAGYKAEGRELGSEPALRYVTASLKVDYLAPTPLGPPIELRGKIVEVKGRKVIVDVSVSVEGTDCAHGEVIAVQVPESLFSGE